ncbi:DUF362 domain-containing protein, partial [candidate division KSB1 bacterium]
VILPKSTVAVVQSTKEKAADLDYPEIKSMVFEAVEKAGGFKDIIHDGDVVVLKPNIMCLWIRSTEEMLAPEANGVTVDWRVTKAVVELIRECNPSGKIYIIEGAAFQETKIAMDSLNYTHKHIPGVDEFICLENSGKYEEWDSPKLTKVVLPEGIGLYPDYMKANKSKEFYMNRKYYEADVIISMPVLKNHLLTGLTGAVKNVGIGSSPPNIYGTMEKITVTSATPASIVSKLKTRIKLERGRKISHTEYYLDKWIHDYYLCKPVDFVITDGLQGLENGPDLNPSVKEKSLKDNQMNMRLILAGKDAVAVDAVHSLIMGYDPYKIMHLLHLSSSGVGCMNPRYIRIIGNKVNDVKKDFEMKVERGAASKYYDFKPPSLSIESVKRMGNQLHLALSVAPETAKVEVAIDGKLLDYIILHSYEDITLDISSIKRGNHKLTVYAYDRFLNCSRQEISID